MNFYLNRIAAYDQKGPRVNAVIAINPRAAKTPSSRIAGAVILSAPAAADLRLGKLYVTITGRTNPLVHLPAGERALA